MLVNVDMDHITNVVVDQLIEKIDPQLSLDEDDRQEILNQIKESFLVQSDDLETLVEALLIQRCQDTTDLMVSKYSELFKLFGGLLNHD